MIWKADVLMIPPRQQRPYQLLAAVLLSCRQRLSTSAAVFAAGCAAGVTQGLAWAAFTVGSLCCVFAPGNRHALLGTKV